MNFEEIIMNIKMLAETQGYYRTFLRRFENTAEGNKKALRKMWESQNFKDIFEMCEYFEGLNLNG